MRAGDFTSRQLHAKAGASVGVAAPCKQHTFPCYGRSRHSSPRARTRASANGDVAEYMSAVSVITCRSLNHYHAKPNVRTYHLRRSAPGRRRVCWSRPWLRVIERNGVGPTARKYRCTVRSCCNQAERRKCTKQWTDALKGLCVPLMSPRPSPQKSGTR